MCAYLVYKRDTLGSHFVSCRQHSQMDFLLGEQLILEYVHTMVSLMMDLTIQRKVSCLKWLSSSDGMHTSKAFSSGRGWSCNKIWNDWGFVTCYCTWCQKFLCATVPLLTSQHFTNPCHTLGCFHTYTKIATHSNKCTLIHTCLIINLFKMVITKFSNRGQIPKDCITYKQRK